MIINYLLSDNDTNCCLICADVNQDSIVSLEDMTKLINILLS